MKALLTGAAGKIGNYAIGALGRRGFDVVATDLASAGIPQDVRFETCDLTDATAVDRLVGLVRPDVVVHCAGILAPVSYVEPELSEAVNLDGTRHLIDATKSHAPDAFFVFVSSYAVFGPCGPGDPNRTATDPCYPDDNYGLQKLTAESWLQQSGLRQCSLRVGAVMDLHNLTPQHEAYRSFVFMVSLAQPEHGVDVRDVARAMASAAVAQPDGHVLLIGGDDSWKLPAQQLRGDLFGAVGLSVPHEEAFRPAPDPNDRAGWFYECWMDTGQSEQLLGFQRITHDAFMDELRKEHRARRMALAPIRPFATWGLTKSSPYTGKNAIKPGPTVWDDICRVYDVPINVAQARSSKPPPPPPF
ncbi:MAG: NAD(P)-dependent oxidoreductase [Polyangiales bacterium]|jgi:nucleoside-diphosphate-sugar epimerase